MIPIKQLSCGWSRPSRSSGPPADPDRIGDSYEHPSRCAPARQRLRRSLRRQVDLARRGDRGGPDPRVLSHPAGADPHGTTGSRDYCGHGDPVGHRGDEQRRRVGADDGAADRDKSSAAQGAQRFRRSRLLDAAGGSVLRLRDAQDGSCRAAFILHPDLVSWQLCGNSLGLLLYRVCAGAGHSVDDGSHGHHGAHRVGHGADVGPCSAEQRIGADHAHRGRNGGGTGVGVRAGIAERSRGPQNVRRQAPADILGRLRAGDDASDADLLRADPGAEPASFEAGSAPAGVH